MPQNEKPPAMPSAGEQDRQADLARFRSGILTLLGQRNLLHAPASDQAAALSQFLRDADRDSAVFTDEQDLGDLISGLQGYAGADFPEHAAQSIQAVLEEEGRYSDRQKFQEKLFVRKNALRGWHTFPGNYSFSYGLEPEMRMVHIHLSNPYIEKDQDEMAGAQGAAVLMMFLKGLKQLADEVVSRNPDIDKITGTSVILGRPEFSGFMEKLGFANLGGVEEEFRKKHFRKEQRSVFRVEADREAFLEAMRKFDVKQLRAEAIKLLRALKENKTEK